MTRKEHVYVLGKCDYNNGGRKNCEATVEWSLTSSGNFSMSGTIWNPRKTDMYSGGQNLEELLTIFPADLKLRRMVEVWREYHLNDLTAGSPAQEAWLKAHPIPKEQYQYPNSHYEVALAKLTEAGLSPDATYLHNGKPYVYGTAWLTTPIPANIVAEIESWSK